MGTLALLALIFGIVGVAASTGLGIYQGVSNEQAIKDTNATNYKIATETNQSNVEQAELAYRRSLPYAQVNNLMAAGMSKQGALSALTGGGTYQAPTLQSSQMQAPLKDFSGVTAAMERLQNIPANVEQAGLVESQRNALAVDTQNKINADARAQEQHEFNMWKQGYDKNTALMLDSGSSKVANALIDSGKTIEDFKDFESMIRGLGLDKDKDIRNLNYVARQQLEDGVRSKFDAERARQQQDNANLAAFDEHLLSELNREDLQNRIKDYNAEKNAREKEYKLRELQADVNTILAKDGLSLADYQHDLEFNEDGSPRFSRKVSERAKRAWDRLSDTIGIGVLKDLIRGVVTIAK